MSKSWSGGSTRAWRRLRARVLLRDRLLCRAHADGWCARERPGAHDCSVRVALAGPDAGHVHHTLGKARTGDDEQHLVAACGPCNRWIGEPGTSAHARARAAADPAPKPQTRWGKL